MENRKSFAILVGIAVMMLLAAGLIFFKKDQRGGALDENKKETRQTIPPKSEPGKLSEEDKVKTMAENFARSYYSYTWGEFGIIEGLYYDMTDKMKEREMARVERIKEKIKSQPRRYFTVKAEVINSSFIEYQENKASLDINLEIEEFNGLVMGLDGVETLVDINGNVYKGNSKDLIGKVFNKKIKIDLVRVEKDWKVNKITD